jgi:hypothetical protein
MGRAAPGSMLPGPVEAPFPHPRIVWHAKPGVGPGVSTLVVNVFDGSVPVAYANLGTNQLSAHDRIFGIARSSVLKLSA